MRLFRTGRRSIRWTTWLSTLEQAEVPVGKIYTAADIHADPHFRHRGMIEPVVLPDGMAVDLPGIVPRLSETPGRTAWIGPPLGAHAGEVLGRLGLDAVRSRGFAKRRRNLSRFGGAVRDRKDSP